MIILLLSEFGVEAGAEGVDHLSHYLVDMLVLQRLFVVLQGYGYGIRFLAGRQLRAIKKATEKDSSDYKEISYEGYGPFGIAIFVEAATDNNTRTVANVRSYFNKHGGSLGTQGSLTFLFEHKCVFKIKPKEGVSLDDLELELIDYGVDELGHDEDEDGNESIVLKQAEKLLKIS